MGFGVIKSYRANIPPFARLILYFCLCYSFDRFLQYAINKAHYGTFSSVEFKSSFFLGCSGPHRVKHWLQARIPVPRETRERYTMLPSFRTKPILEGGLVSGGPESCKASVADMRLLVYVGSPCRYFRRLL
jgi:hypothetical protein